MGFTGLYFFVFYFIFVYFGATDQYWCTSLSYLLFCEFPGIEKIVWVYLGTYGYLIHCLLFCVSCVFDIYNYVLSPRMNNYNTNFPEGLFAIISACCVCVSSVFMYGKYIFLLLFFFCRCWFYHYIYINIIYKYICIHVSCYYEILFLHLLSQYLFPPRIIYIPFKNFRY